MKGIPAGSVIASGAVGVVTVEYLLAPIATERPAGVDITVRPEWLAISEARRKDKLTDRRDCDWPLVYSLLTEALAHTSKDLRLAIWLMEASIKLYGFHGLREGARLLSGLIATYWDSGLYPENESGDFQFRAMPLEWLNSDNFAEAIYQIPLTARTGGGQNYSWSDYAQSRIIGREQDIRNSLGDIDSDKESIRKAALASGSVSAEMFDECVKNTPGVDLEAINADIEGALDDIQKLGQIIDHYFGHDELGIGIPKEALENCRDLMGSLRKTKPDKQLNSAAAGQEGAIAGRGKATLDSFAFALNEGSADGQWLEAEELVKRGNADAGLSQMTQIASHQYGRVRFQQRLRLAEICLETTRERLAIIVLEELARNIDELHLEKWEAPELLGRVWGRLYRCYRTADAGSEQNARADMFFDRLCKLDPWQALRWDT